MSTKTSSVPLLSASLMVVVATFMAQPSGCDLMVGARHVLYNADTPDVDYLYLNNGYSGDVIYPMGYSPALAPRPVVSAASFIGGPVYIRPGGIVSTPFVPLYKK